MSCESSLADLTMEMFEDNCRDQFVTHINELQEAVAGMKSAFTTAQLQLESVHSEDRTLRDEMNQTKNQCQQQSAEILRLILSLKSEVSSLKETLQTTQIVQRGLQSAVSSLVLERDFLLDELAKNAAISEAVRGRLRSRSSGFDRPSSGSQSTNDSGVALLLEKAHAAFNGASHSHLGLFRDNDFLPGEHHHESLGISHHVHEYLNGLSLTSHHPTASDPSCYPSFAGPGASYDSDSSLTLAATKSLSLSNSLSKQCGLELDQEDEKNRARRKHEDSDDSDSSQVTRNAEKAGIMAAVQQEQAEYFNHSPTSDGAELLQNIGLHNEVDDEMNFKETQRLRVARELIETERKYCHTLRTIQDTFAQPLRNSGILSMKDINTLFPEEVFDLYDKHFELLRKLDERIENWNTLSTIGDLLDEFTNTEGSNVLRLYTSYVNDFDSCLNTFHKLCRNSSDFTKFLKSCLEQPSCGGLDLGAFLLTPVQRMPRYILLLKQMIKFTEPTHPDHLNINRCLERLRDYLKRLNDSMEHSFQLVTAQLSPQGNSNNNGFVNKPNSFTRASLSSRSSTGEEIVHKIRYKRSTSVPRNQKDPDGASSTCKAKLKLRSKSDWAVCKAANGSQDHQRCHSCNCKAVQTSGVQKGRNTNSNGSCLNKPLERAVSDSDLNSDDEEDKVSRKFTTSKSLHDFKRGTWDASSQSSLRDNENEKQNINSSENGEGSKFRNNLLLRPLAAAESSGTGKFAARIISERGSEPELSSKGGKSVGTTKKRTSIRASLKNMFSLKKRSSRSVEISHPILPPLNGNSHSATQFFFPFGGDGHRQRERRQSSRESVVMINYEPSISPIDGPNFNSANIQGQGPTRVSPLPPRPLPRTFGSYYLDEDGKPCTNV